MFRFSGEKLVVLQAPDNVPNHYQIFIDEENAFSHKDPKVKRIYLLDEKCEIMYDLLRLHFYGNLVNAYENIYKFDNIDDLYYVGNRIEPIIQFGIYPEVGEIDEIIDGFIIRLLNGNEYTDEEFYEMIEKDFPLIKTEDLHTLEGSIENCVPHIMKPEYIKEYGVDKLSNLIYNESELIRRRLRFDFGIINDEEHKSENLIGMLKNKHIFSTLELLGIFRYVTDYKFSFCKGDFSIGFNLKHRYRLGTKDVSGYLDDGMYGEITDIDEEGNLVFESSEDYKFEHYYYNSGAGTVSIIKDLIKMLLFARRY